MSSVVARGLQFNYSILGEGSPPIVTMHGLLLDNMSSFFFTIGPELAKRSRVLLYDFRGHGRSDQPHEGYSIDELAKDTDALLDATRFADEPVVVVGHSFGGLVALRYALLFPQRVRGLVLIEAHTGSPEFGVRMAESLNAPDDQREAMLRDLFGNWVTLQEARGRADDVTTTIGQLERRTARREKRGLRTIQTLIEGTTLVSDIARTDPVSREDLSRLTAPVLALYGAESDILDDGKALADALPHCELAILPNCGHGVLWQDRSVLLPPIHDWLERLP